MDYESLNPVERGLVTAVAYADIFDFAPSVAETHRYIVEAPASLAEVSAALAGDRLIGTYLSFSNGLLTLRGREYLAQTRRERDLVTASQWLTGVRYGRAIAALPFVRMVAITGSLAVGNMDTDSDIDYLVVTEPGRLWTCRALVIGLVRAAAFRGTDLCPNYFLSSGSLELEDRSLFAAHELAQMVPLSGLETYDAFRSANAWTAQFLPNAVGPPVLRHSEGPMVDRKRSRLKGGIRTVSEVALLTWPARRIERWEMDRKLRRFRAQPAPNGEAAFSADACKGHFDGHGERVMRALEERLERIVGAPT